MTRGWTARRRLNVAAWALVALAVAFRLTFAPGYMLSATPERVAMVICTGEGAVSRLVDIGGHGGGGGGQLPADNENPGQKSPCAFAMAGPALAPPATITPVRVSAYLAAPVLAGMSVAPGLGLAAPPPPATGPPSLI